MSIDDNTFWWWMIGLACAAVAVSIAASILDRRNVEWLSKPARHRLHMTSYVLTTLSILIFIARGILLP